MPRISSARAPVAPAETSSPDCRSSPPQMRTAEAPQRPPDTLQSRLLPRGQRHQRSPHSSFPQSRQRLQRGRPMLIRFAERRLLFAHRLFHAQEAFLPGRCPRLLCRSSPDSLSPESAGQSSSSLENFASSARNARFFFFRQIIFLFLSPGGSPFHFRASAPAAAACQICVCSCRAARVSGTALLRQISALRLFSLRRAAAPTIRCSFQLISSADFPRLHLQNICCFSIDFRRY